jgi:hypothetical protein
LSEANRSELARRLKAYVADIGCDFVKSSARGLHLGRPRDSSSSIAVATRVRGADTPRIARPDCQALRPQKIHAANQHLRF